MLVEKQVDNGITLSDLHNIQQRFCNDQFSGMPEFISDLEQTGHQVRTRVDSDDKVNAVFFMHEHGRDELRRLPESVIIDATYKTNEYRIPLLEVVGITSTLRICSLMFTYLPNEKSDQLTWALGTLKNLMFGKGALMPSVFVSDRDLALMKAMETCFPTARHILCIWHINQNVVKYCNPILGSEMKRFLVSWHSLIMSSTQESYQ